MNDVERRTVTVDMKIEKRADEAPRIRGHAAMFNTMSQNLGWYREMITPGAFSEAIQSDDVRALWNHNPDHVLGRNKAGTLILSEDERGLAIEIIPPDTQLARDLMTSIERGDVSQMSFAFSVRPNGQSWGQDEEGNEVRTLTNVRLFDVSPVTYPAYTETDVAVRAFNEWKKEHGGEQQATDYSLQRRKLDLLEIEV
jgi:uncharacterized protein